MGKALGEVSVDFGGVAVCDIEAFASIYGTDEYRRWIEAVHEGPWEARRGVAEFPAAQTSLVWVEGGFGDGAYTVYGLTEAGAPRGLEVEFIAPHTPYPFGDAA